MRIRFGIVLVYFGKFMGNAPIISAFFGHFVSKFIKIQKIVDNCGENKLYCIQFNRYDRGAVIISTLAKPAGIGEGKGITAEGLCSFLAAGSWVVGEYPADCRVSGALSLTMDFCVFAMS